MTAQRPTNLDSDSNNNITRHESTTKIIACITIGKNMFLAATCANIDNRAQHQILLKVENFVIQFQTFIKQQEFIFTGKYDDKFINTQFKTEHYHLILFKK